ncbi:hypothetical protein NMY22_g6029 [Coprinellus aureogranulatus]|nr:hypothetical protein NMY22_g6029 [Coprinellus aureogranulatus]
MSAFLANAAINASALQCPICGQVPMKGAVVPECLVLKYAGRRVAVHLDAQQRKSLTFDSCETYIRGSLGISRDVKLKYYTTELTQCYGQSVEISVGAWTSVLPWITVLVVEAVNPDAGDHGAPEDADVD